MAKHFLMIETPDNDAVPSSNPSTAVVASTVQKWIDEHGQGTWYFRGVTVIPMPDFAKERA